MGTYYRYSICCSACNSFVNYGKCGGWTDKYCHSVRNFNYWGNIGRDVQLKKYFALFIEYDIIIQVKTKGGYFDETY